MANIQRVYLQTVGECNEDCLTGYLEKCGIDVSLEAPPLVLPDTEMYIHLFGNPVKIVLSIFDKNERGLRDYLEEKMSALGVEGVAGNLKDYCLRMKDSLKIAEHFSKSVGIYREIEGPAMMIHADHIWLNEKGICQCIGGDAKHEMPARTQRISTWANHFYIDRLSSMYNQMNLYIEENPKIYYKPR